MNEQQKMSGTGKEPDSIKILDVTLLSEEEAMKLDADTLQSTSDWWLKTTGGYPAFVATVCDDGNIFSYGLDARTSVIGIRPVLMFEDSGQVPKPGDRFSRNGLDWMVISEGKALCDTIVKEMPFRKYRYSDNSYYDVTDREVSRADLNIYEQSDAYRYLHDDFLKEYGVELSGETPSAEQKTRSAAAASEKVISANAVSVARYLAGCDDIEFAEIFALYSKSLDMDSDEPFPDTLSAEEMRNLSVEKVGNHIKNALDEIVYSGEMDESAWWKDDPDRNGPGGTPGEGQEEDPEL